MGHEKELLWSFMNFHCHWCKSLSELLIHCRILDKVCFLNFHCHWCISLSELFSFLCLALVSVWKFCKLHSIPCHERNGVDLCNCPIRKGPVSGYLDKLIEILMPFYLDKLYLICFVLFTQSHSHASPSKGLGLVCHWGCVILILWSSYWNSTGIWPISAFNIAIKITHLSKRKKKA